MGSRRAKAKRGFGEVAALPRGRFRGRYPGPAGARPLFRKVPFAAALAANPETPSIPAAIAIEQRRFFIDTTPFAAASSRGL